LGQGTTTRALPGGKKYDHVYNSFDTVPVLALNGQKDREREREREVLDQYRTARVLTHAINNTSDVSG